MSTLTGTQVMLLVASETGHVYTFATRKLEPMITSEAGRALIRTCLFSPEPPTNDYHPRMSANGYEETELSYSLNEDSSEKVSHLFFFEKYLLPYLQYFITNYLLGCKILTW